MTSALESNRNVLAAADLSRLESDADEVEARLERDLVTGRRASEAAAVRLAELQAIAEEAALGRADEETLAVCRAARELSAPRFDEAAARASLHEARLTALRHRSLASEAVRGSLDTFTHTAAELTHRIAQELERLRSLRSRQDHEAAAARLALETEASALEAALLTVTLPQPPEPRKRRELPRVALNVEVDLGSDSNFYGGFSTNISEGGLFIATVMHPPRGAMVDVRFSLGGRDIEARGVVRWTREVNDCLPDVMPGAGVQFIDLAAETAQAISDFVSKREPLFYVE